MSDQSTGEGCSQGPKQIFLTQSARQQKPDQDDPKKPSTNVGQATATRTRRVSDLVQHFESGSQPKQTSATPPSVSVAAAAKINRERRTSLPEGNVKILASPLGKCPTASPLAIPKNALADKKLSSGPLPARNVTSEQNHSLLPAAPSVVQPQSQMAGANKSNPVIQRGALSDMDWSDQALKKSAKREEFGESTEQSPVSKHLICDADNAKEDPISKLSTSRLSTTKQAGPDVTQGTPRKNYSRPSQQAASQPSQPTPFEASSLTTPILVRSKAEPKGELTRMPDMASLLIDERLEVAEKHQSSNVRQDPETVTQHLDGLPANASRLPSLISVNSGDQHAMNASRLLPAIEVNISGNGQWQRQDANIDISKACPYNEDSPDAAPLLTQPLSKADPEATSMPMPMAANKVFSRNSLPLRLPALDAHLSDGRKFPSPKFTPSHLICSETERELFRLQPLNTDSNKDCAKGHQLSGVRKHHAAGRQLRLPAGEDERHASGISCGWSRSRQKTRRGFKEVSGIDEDQELGIRESREHMEGGAGMDSLTHMEAFEKGSSYLPNLSPDATVDSQMSTNTHPITRTQMFPPLMLLRTNALKELKSNAVGPRAPKKGFLGSLPGLSSILGTILDTLLGLEGSSFAANLFRLELLRDFAQMMRANLTFRDQTAPETSKVNRFIFDTIPAFLALDFVSIFGMAIIWLLVWMGITACGLFWFWKRSSAYDPNKDIQGYEGQPYIFRSAKRGNKAANVFMTFMLTSLYMPLSKIAVDALVWSSDYWPSADSQATRDQQGMAFCYTTTVQKDQFNFAWLILPAAGLTVLVYTILWPLYLVKVIRAMRPRVSQFNELGVKRSPEEMDREYQRQLNHDKSPLNYLYNGYNRRFPGYKPFYLMFFKFTTLLVLSIFTSKNCLWRKKPVEHVVVIQQGVLIGLQAVLLGVHIWTKPFVDVISNRSELVSRTVYVFTAVIGLLVALRVKGSNVYQSVILWIIQGFSYTFSIYFSLVSTGAVSRLIKRLQSRLDFSIDIYSPVLDFEKHIKRRVWEETLSIILLTGQDYRMPVESDVAFSASDKWPPYLLFFRGSPAERHVENLMILKDLGLERYKLQVEAMASEAGQRLQGLITRIQKHHAGPDAYFRPIQGPYSDGVTSFFGKAFVVPFPPTLVFRYDQQNHESITLTSLSEFELFVHQNESKEVQEKKSIRHCLRALDGQRIICPFQLESGRHFDSGPTRRNTFSTSSLHRRRKKVISVPLVYNEGILSVGIKDFLPWDGYNFSSGFDVSVIYAHGQRMDPQGVTWVKHEVKISAAEAFGLHGSFIMTHELSRMLHQNDHILQFRLPEIRHLLHRYREYFYHEARRKRETLTYSFLTNVFDNSHLPSHSLSSSFKSSSNLSSVQNLPQRYPACMSSLYQRLQHIRQSQVHMFWYLFWDDLFRQNGNDFKILRCHQRHNLKYFDPKFPTSIAYRPMPRSRLEALLQERGAWQEDGQKGLLHRGVLNRLYFCLNRLVFAPRHQEDGGECKWDKNEIPLGISDTGSPKRVVDILPYHPAEDHDHPTTQHSPAESSSSDTVYDQPCSSSHKNTVSVVNSLGTGGGTSSLRSIIPNRPAWAWEQKFDGRPARSMLKRMGDYMLEVLNIRPFLIHKEKDGNLWVWVKEVDGEYLHVVPPEHVRR
ncbi:unnamed protein product [Sympodiomycopsis kandeliae]